MSTINASATYYHLTPEGADASTAWMKGGPRKGMENGQKAIGLVLFKKASIISAHTGTTFSAAELVLHRDTAYGTDAVDISIAPVTVSSVSGNATYAACMSLANRPIHHLTTVKGDEARIRLPGRMVQLLNNTTKPITGFMIYQEDGEGTKLSARFTAEAQLELTTGNVLTPPVWTRPIGKGDVISGDVCSHVSDLQELVYYIDRRMYHNSLIGITVDNYNVGPDSNHQQFLYAKWPEIIRLMQDALDRVIAAEEAQAVVWKRAAANALPNAEIINQLRDFLNKLPGGAEETITLSSYGRTYFDHLDTDFTVNYDATTSWAARAPWSGMNWEYVTVDGVKRKKYNRRFGIWLLREAMAGKTVTSAKIRLTRNVGNSGSRAINLHPVIVSQVPAGRMSINQVVDLGTVIGSGEAAIGETVEIELSADAITQLQSGNWYGVGVDDHDHWTNFGADAALILNGGTTT